MRTRCSECEEQFVRQVQHLVMKSVAAKDKWAHKATALCAGCLEKIPLEVRTKSGILSCDNDKVNICRFTHHGYSLFPEPQFTIPLDLLQQFLPTIYDKLTAKSAMAS